MKKSLHILFWITVVIPGLLALACLFQIFMEFTRLPLLRILAVIEFDTVYYISLAVGFAIAPFSLLYFAAYFSQKLALQRVLARSALVLLIGYSVTILFLRHWALTAAYIEYTVAFFGVAISGGMRLRDSLRRKRNSLTLN
jgi:hypothetical protein